MGSADGGAIADGVRRSLEPVAKKFSAALDKFSVGFPSPVPSV
jgi:hypothetical protein